MHEPSKFWSSSMMTQNAVNLEMPQNISTKEHTSSMKGIGKYIYLQLFHVTHEINIKSVHR